MDEANRRVMRVLLLLAVVAVGGFIVLPMAMMLVFMGAPHAIEGQALGPLGLQFHFDNPWASGFMRLGVALFGLLMVMVAAAVLWLLWPGRRRARAQRTTIAAPQDETEALLDLTRKLDRMEERIGNLETILTDRVR